MGLYSLLLAWLYFSSYLLLVFMSKVDYSVLCTFRDRSHSNAGLHCCWKQCRVRSNGSALPVTDREDPQG
jgi:hypothetical protein